MFTTHEERLAAFLSKVEPAVSELGIRFLGNKTNYENLMSDLLRYVWQDDTHTLNVWVLNSASSLSTGAVFGAIALMREKSKFNTNYNGREDAEKPKQTPDSGVSVTTSG